MDRRRAVVELLIRDAGYEPTCGGPLENARIQEDFLLVMSAISNDIGQCFYRYAPPENL